MYIQTGRLYLKQQMCRQKPFEGTLIEPAVSNLKNNFGEALAVPLFGGFKTPRYHAQYFTTNKITVRS